MKRQNGQTLYSAIKEALQTIRTFDLSNDEHGYPKLGWLIAHWILRDLSEFERNWRLYKDGFGDVIHTNIWNAAKHLQELGIPVYRSPKGNRLEYITLDPNYREAEAMDFNRIADRQIYQRRAALKEIQFKHSRRLAEFTERTTKLLVGSGNSPKKF